MSDLTERRVRIYVDQFEAAARVLPRGDRAEAVRRVRLQLRRDVIDAELSPAEAGQYLAQLGSPEDLAALAMATVHWRRTGFGLAAAAALFVPTVPPLGLFLLWRCQYWTRLEKWTVSVAIPGGIPAALLLWPRIVAPSLGAGPIGVVADLLCLVCAASAFYLGLTFAWRANYAPRPGLENR